MQDAAACELVSAPSQVSTRLFLSHAETQISFKAAVLSLLAEQLDCPLRSNFLPMLLHALIDMSRSDFGNKLKW